MNTKLSKLQGKIDKLNNEIRAGFDEALKEAADEIFVKYPKLKDFHWVQYTPYFNDGEPCEFSIHDDCGYTYGEFECGHYDSAITSEYDYEKRVYKNEKLSDEAAVEFTSIEEAEELQKELNEFVGALCAFENHVRAVLGEGKIIVSRDGVETEDYDHD